MTYAVKLLGEVLDVRPREIAAFSLWGLRVSWIWLSVPLMAAAFFSFLAMPSWIFVGFVIPATSLA